MDWATAKLNLGAALDLWGKATRSRERLREGVAALDDATLELTHERDPLGWASIQNNVGIALIELASFEAAPIPILERAIGNLQAALTERTRERVPEDWALTTTSLGSAERALAQRRSLPACAALDYHMQAVVQMNQRGMPHYVMRIAGLVEQDLRVKPEASRTSCPELPDTLWPLVESLMSTWREKQRH